MTHYDHAPITEALIDIQFGGVSASVDDLLTAHEHESAKYPEKKPMVLASVKIDGTVSPDSASFTDQTSQRLGWAFISDDKLQVWQARTSGFTFARLAPYQSWEPFREEARRLWLLTRAAAKPETITRVAVRYINRLELPLPFTNFNEYLRNAPEVSPLLPQALSGFFMQLQIPQEDLRGMLILNHQLIPTDFPGKTTASVLLDIDLFKLVELPQDEEGLWGLLELLHTKKNEIFEASITDRMREIIK